MHAPRCGTQAHIDRTIVEMQELTANPRTATGRGALKGGGKR